MCAVIDSLERRRLFTSLPPQFVQSPVTDGVPFGSTLEIAPDGKLFVVEQPGRIQVYSDYTSGTLLQPNFFRDAQPAVNFSGERGLFGITFDPDYATNHYVYVHYTKDAFPFPNRVTRFTANPTGDLALPNSETVLLEMEPSPNSNHNGGGMHFGPDGKLYVGVGDNAVGANAQSLSTLKGKILRMNVTPGDIIPADNPTSFDGIAGTTSGIHRLIWAAGLRNPYTFAFQPGTGRMYINDVGEVSWEEIDEGAPGRTSAGRRPRATLIRRRFRAMRVRSSRTRTSVNPSPAARSSARRFTTRPYRCSRPTTPATISSPTSWPGGFGASIRSRSR